MLQTALHCSSYIANGSLFITKDEMSDFYMYHNSKIVINFILKSRYNVAKPNLKETKQQMLTFFIPSVSFQVKGNGVLNFFCQKSILT